MATNPNESKESNRPSSIAEALRLLDEALSTDVAPALRDVVSAEFDNVKKVLRDYAGTNFEQATEKFEKVSSKASEVAGETLREMNETIRQYSGEFNEAFDRVSAVAIERTSELAAEGIAQGREIGIEVDRKVRENPWPVLGGIAVGTLALGFLLGRRRGSDF